MTIYSPRAITHINKLTLTKYSVDVVKSNTCNMKEKLIKLICSLGSVVF